MAYPVVMGANQDVCPTSHPVALPMIEFKMAWPVNGDMSQVRLASGTGHSFHYDFFNAWDDATQAALVKTCINGGLQCDARGYDQHHPEVPAALTEADKHRLLDDIDADLAASRASVTALPRSSRVAVAAAHSLFDELSGRLRATPAAEIAQHRVRVPAAVKNRVAMTSLVRGLAP